MKKVHMFEEYTAERLKEGINYLLTHEDYTVTNIQYQAVSITSSRQSDYDGEINFDGSIYHTALVEYEVHENDM